MRRTTPSNLQVFCAVCITIFGCLSLGYMLLLMVTTLTTQGKRPIDILPANETVVLVIRPNAHVLSDPLAPEVPNDQITPTDTAEAVALLENERKERSTAIFFRQGMRLPEIWEGSGTVVAHPPFTVVLSNAALQGHLGRPEDVPLARSAPYVEFSKQHKKEASWVYARPDKIDKLSPLTKTLLADARVLTSSWENNRWSVNSITKWTRPGTSVNYTLPHHQNALFTLTNADIDSHLEEILSVLHGKDVPLVEAYVRTEGVRTFGPSVSWEYDIAHLFDGPGSLQLQAEKDGHITWTLLGLEESTKEIAKQLAVLHASVLRTSDSVEEYSRTLDERFVSKDARIKPEAQASTYANIAGWRVRRSEGGQGRVLITAVSDHAFLMTTRNIALADFAKTIQVTDIPASTMAHGTINREKLRELLLATTIDLDTVLPRDPRLTQSLLQWWALQSKGRILLTLESETL